MNTKFWTKFCIPVLILFSLISCVPYNLRSSLLNNSCNPPCWSMINPGETTAKEAIQILNTSMIIEESSIERILAKQYYPPDQIFFDLKGHGTGNLSVNNEIVTTIRLQKMDIPLGTMIKEYGQPAQIMILPYWEWDGKWFVTFLYPDQGIILRYIKKVATLKENSILIESNDRVIEMYFTTPREMKNLILSLIFGFPEDEDFDYQTIIQKYEGYKEVPIIRPLE